MPRNIQIYVSQKENEDAKTWKRRLKHGFGEVLNSLSNTQIGQNLLCTSKDGIEFVAPVEVFNNLTHTGLSQTTTTEDVGCRTGDFAGTLGRVGFKKGDGAGEMFGLLCVAHLAHLVGEGFEPGLVCFDLGDHFGESIKLR